MSDDALLALKEAVLLLLESERQRLESYRESTAPVDALVERLNRDA